MKFSEFLIYESFDISSKPIRMNIPNMREYLIGYLSQKYTNPIPIADNLISEYKKTQIFKVNGSEEYIILLLTNQDNITEVHFNNYSKVDYFDETNTENVPLSMFGKIFNIIYWYALVGGHIVTLTHSDHDRLLFYKNIIDKVINKHSLKYSAYLEGNTLMLKDTTTIPFTERFL